jgi:transposase
LLYLVEWLINGVPESEPAPANTEELIARLVALSESKKQLTLERDAATTERDEYKRQYVLLLEAYRKLEAGLVGQKRERFVGNSEQLTLEGLLKLVLPTQAPPETCVPEHTRAKPTGRKPLPENLPRVEVEVVPPDVQKAGLDAFDRIGEDVSEVVEHRPSSFVVVRTIRPKYVAKAKVELLAAGESTPVVQAPALELPIPRALAGPGLLADTIVKRWENHLPLYRLERMYGREGLPLARSTICGWHGAAAELVAPLVEAMFLDARMNSPYLCVDATGVLVQERDKCRRAHFFVVVAPGKHVLFAFSPKHNGKAVDELLAGYQGFLVADAHSVYEHLYEDGTVLEVGCWAHARRYQFKSLETDGARARHALSLVQALFKLERQYATAPPDEKLRRRQREAKPIVDAFFAWCDEESLKVLDHTPISKAIGYARNQREALCRFLTDGRLPIHNNHSENALRREALGRKNWLFLGGDDGGEVNATLVTLLASCQQRGIEPQGYLRDLFCLLPSWSAQRVLELAPAYWATTLEVPGVRDRLAANVFRQAALGELKPIDKKHS